MSDGNVSEIGNLRSEAKAIEFLSYRNILDDFGYENLDCVIVQDED